MKDESQLQNILSWSLPRRVEELNRKNSANKTWSSFTPPNSKQSTFDLSSMGFDVLAILDSDYSFSLELKISKLTANGRFLDFGVNQLNFLKKVDEVIPTYICFDSDEDDFGKNADSEDFDSIIFARKFLPSEKFSSEWLGKIVAIEPSKLIDNLGELAIEITSFRLDSGSESVRDIFDNFFVKSRRSDDDTEDSRLTKVGQAITKLIENQGELPPNLFFIYVSENGMTPVSVKNIAVICKILSLPNMVEIKKVIARVSKYVKENHRLASASNIFSDYEFLIKSLSGIVENSIIGAPKSKEDLSQLFSDSKSASELLDEKITKSEAGLDAEKLEYESNKKRKNKAKAVGEIKNLREILKNQPLAKSKTKPPKGKGSRGMILKSPKVESNDT